MAISKTRGGRKGGGPLDHPAMKARVLAEAYLDRSLMTGEREEKRENSRRTPERNISKNETHRYLGRFSEERSTRQSGGKFPTIRGKKVGGNLGVESRESPPQREEK